MHSAADIRAVAIGSFDGIHRGHQALIEEADALVIIERNSGYLTPGYKRSVYTDRYCCFYHFEKIKGLSPEGFVAMLKRDFPSLEKIVVGYDFHFGKGKAGNAEILKALFEGEVAIIEQVCYEGTPVHSRVIKQALREGHVADANALLGRVYAIEGDVIRGQGLGKHSFVPTINLQIEGYQLPLDGVYATRTEVSGVWYDSVTFLGHRVTTDGNFAVETHLLDHTIDREEIQVSIAFIARIRDNEKFEDFEALKAAIHQDIRLAKAALGR